MPDREPRDVLGEALRRLESALGPDTEIDALIAEITGAPFGRFGYADEENEIAPRFTASLDAAQSLVPPGWFWQVEMAAVFRKACAVRADNTLEGADAISFIAFRRAEIAEQRRDLCRDIECLDKEEKKLASQQPLAADGS